MFRVFRPIAFSVSNFVYSVLYTRNLIGVLYPVYHTLTILRNHTEMDYVEMFLSIIHIDMQYNLLDCIWHPLRTGVCYSFH